MKKIALISAIFSFAFFATAQNPFKDKLGKQKGLGSHGFVLVDTSFAFSQNLGVEGKLYSGEFDERYNSKEHFAETCVFVDTVFLAYDSVAWLSSEEGEIFQGAIPAIKIFPERWHTIYGETQIFTSVVEPVKFRGNGNDQSRFYIIVCPTEQPCFSLSVESDCKDEFKKEFARLMVLINSVGSGRNRP